MRSRHRVIDRVFQPEIALGIFVAAVVATMVVPLPTPLLDVLIASNLALSVLLLLVSLSVRDGLAFTALPTLLLLSTLYRLALNVSSTRLILLQADAGEIIAAFGDFVVRGDYAVGAAVILVLTIVQYVVVARGAERVAEVGARFSLDALPGKQMAIDADLRSGALSAGRARELRQALERESRFYGAMDGAMKFVKGDAIAGIAIATVSFVAGTAIGSLRDARPLSESLRLYGLLAIGDALVSQLPSLLVATSAGLVVTRVAGAEADASLGRDLGQQLLGHPRALWTGAGLFLALMLIPGLPAAPFAALAGVLALFAVQKPARASDASTAPAPEQARVELGAALSAELLGAASFTAALAACAARVRSELGVPLRAIGAQRDDGLGAREFRVLVAGAVVRRGEAPTGDALPALRAAVEDSVKSHAADLLGLDETQGLLDELALHSPVLAQHVVPQAVSLRALAHLLQQLVAERVPIEPLRPVLEAIAAESGGAGGSAALIERVRVRLARRIFAAHGAAGTLRAHAVDPMIEDAVRDAVQGDGDGAYLALPPDLAADIVAGIRGALDARDPAAVLLTQPDVRRWLRGLIEHELSGVAVLSYAELPPDAVVSRLAPVRAQRPSAR